MRCSLERMPYWMDGQLLKALIDHIRLVQITGFMEAWLPMMLTKVLSPAINLQFL